MNNKTALAIGIIVLAFLIITFFIPVTVESGPDYQVFSSLLGIIIFHNPMILSIYIALGVFFIYKGFRKKHASPNT